MKVLEKILIAWQTLAGKEGNPHSSEYERKTSNGKLFVVEYDIQQKKVGITQSSF